MPYSFKIMYSSYPLKRCKKLDLSKRIWFVSWNDYFCSPKIEFEDAHDKIDETILKQLTNTSNDLQREEVIEEARNVYKLEEGTWRMDIEMEHF
jgi:hypothetical protein